MAHRDKTSFILHLQKPKSSFENMVCKLATTVLIQIRQTVVVGIGGRRSLWETTKNLAPKLFLNFGQNSSLSIVFKFGAKLSARLKYISKPKMLIVLASFYDEIRVPIRKSANAKTHTCIHLFVKSGNRRVCTDRKRVGIGICS